MAEKLDLLKIAQEEQTGDLFKLLDQTFKRSKVQPRGISDAIIWEGGNPIRQRQAGRACVYRHVCAQRHPDGARRSRFAVPGRADDGAVPPRYQTRFARVVRQDGQHLPEMVDCRRLHGQRQRQKSRRRGQIGQRAAAHRRRRLLQRAALWRHYQHSFHAGSAVFAGQQEIRRRQSHRQYPLRDEYARRAHGLCRAPVS